MRCGLRNGTEAVPYKSYRRDTPPGVSDRTTKRRIRFDFPCHCEAEGRGDRRECLWCNLLVSCADLYNVPGDSYVASLLGMTGGKIVRIRRGAVGIFVCPAERSMPVPCEEISPNSKKEVTPRFVSR